MATKKLAPATKQDIAVILARFDAMDAQFHMQNERFAELDDKIDLNQKCMLMKLELVRKDIFDVQGHRVSQLDHRVTRLERHTGLVK